MSESAFVQMLAVCGAAVGLMLLGGARAVVGRRSAGVRVTVTAACVLAPAAALAAFGFPASAGVSAGVVAVVAAGFTLVGSEATLIRLVSALHRFGRPGVQAAMLSVGGAALLVGGVTRYETAFEAELDAQLAEMSRVTWRPPLDPVPDVAATTDAGRQIKLLQPASGGRPAAEARAAEHNTLSNMAFTDRLIRVQPAGDVSNCHGWVFAGGRYWIGPEDVEAILADNGYRTVSDPRPGDLAIYREGTAIAHTGIVRTGGPGVPLLIESKWGWMGVFLHRPEDTCYGQQITFYRGARDTHLVAGLSASNPPRTKDAPAVETKWLANTGFAGH